MTCYLCNGTNQLMRYDWAREGKYKCIDCSIKGTRNRAVAELPSEASSEWKQKAKEINGRLMAKYK